MSVPSFFVGMTLPRPGLPLWAWRRLLACPGFRPFVLARRTARRAGHRNRARDLLWVLEFMRGLEEGRAEARVQFRRDGILVLLDEKFGAVPPEVEARVRAATDPDELAAALRQVLRINAPGELVL